MARPSRPAVARTGPPRSGCRLPARDLRGGRPLGRAVTQRGEVRDQASTRESLNVEHGGRGQWRLTEQDGPQGGLPAHDGTCVGQHWRLTSDGARRGPDEPCCYGGEALPWRIPVRLGYQLYVVYSTIRRVSGICCIPPRPVLCTRPRRRGAAHPREVRHGPSGAVVRRGSDGLRQGRAPTGTWARASAQDAAGSRPQSVTASCHVSPATSARRR